MAVVIFWGFILHLVRWLFILHLVGVQQFTDLRCGGSTDEGVSAYDRSSATRHSIWSGQVISCAEGIDLHPCSSTDACWSDG